MNPDSLWRSSLRALLITFFSVIGFFLALTAFILPFSLFDGTEDSVSNDYTVTIRPNADGVRKKLSNKTPVILELDVEGVIGGLELSQKTVENILIESRENTLADNRVKAVLVHINSPGGTMNDADGIYRALLTYKSRYNTPIIAYTDGICASGGMYVACAADAIYASDVTMVGSIGVITPPFMNVTELMNKVGVATLTLYSGKGKDELNPFRPWKADEDKNIQEIIQFYYNSFVDVVVKHRPKIDKETLVSEIGAQVYPAQIAEQNGLIDGAGMTRENALKKLVEKAGISGEYQVVRLESSNWLHQLFKAESPVFTGKIRHEFPINGKIPQELAGQPLYFYQP